MVGLIKIPPCELPMVPLVPKWQQKNVQGFLVTIGKNGINGTIGRFVDFTIGKTPERSHCLFLICNVILSHWVNNPVPTGMSSLKRGTSVEGYSSCVNF